MRLKVSLSPGDLSRLIGSGRCASESPWDFPGPPFAPITALAPAPPPGPPAPGEAGSLRAGRAGRPGQNGGYGCVSESGTTKAPSSHLKLKGSLRKSRQRRCRCALAYGTPSGSPSPRSLAPLAAQPPFSHSHHRTRLISPPSALPPSFPRSLLSQEPEPHCCEAGARWKGHARTPRLGVPRPATDAPVKQGGTPVSAPHTEKQLKHGHCYVGTHAGTHASIRDTNGASVWATLKRHMRVPADLHAQVPVEM